MGTFGKVGIPEEEAISEAIVAEIEKLQADKLMAGSSDGSSLLDTSTELEFAVEQPRTAKKGIGKKAKPTDIRVYRRGSEILDLRIEAKVLLRDGDVGKTYLAANGMGRFSDPLEPYTEHEVGGMLAYTFSDDQSTWTTLIKTGLGSAKPPYANFEHQLGRSADTTLFCRVPFKLKNGSSRSEVLVFHIVLEFDATPAAR